MVLPNRPSPLPDEVTSTVTVPHTVEKQRNITGLLTPDDKLLFDYSGNRAIREGADMARYYTRKLITGPDSLGTFISSNIKDHKAVSGISFPILSAIEHPLPEQPDAYIALTPHIGFKVGLRESPGTFRTLRDATDSEVLAYFPALIWGIFTSGWFDFDLPNSRYPSDVAKVLKVWKNLPQIISEMETFSQLVLARSPQTNIPSVYQHLPDKALEYSMARRQKAFQFWESRFDLLQSVESAVASGDENKIKEEIATIMQMAVESGLCYAIGDSIDTSPINDWGYRINPASGERKFSVTRKGEIEEYLPDWTKQNPQPGTLLEKGVAVNITKSLIMTCVHFPFENFPWIESFPRMERTDAIDSKPFFC